MRLRLGTRGSALARAQAALVVRALQARDPDLQVDVVVITTSGDGLPAGTVVPGVGAPGLGAPRVGPPAGVPGVSAPAGGTPSVIKGLFTTEIEQALLRGEIDVAVHSLKDLPALEGSGVLIAAFTPREDPRDVVVARSGRRLHDLPAGTTVGTASARRDVLVREARPDLTVVPIRGNVDTRLRKVAEGQVDAVVLAAAGLIRLGRGDAITERLDPERFVPAPGQGALAVQVRADDGSAARAVGPLDDPATRVAVTTEHLFAGAVGGGCRLPVGAYARVRDGRLILVGLVAADRPVRVRREGALADAAALARDAASAVLAGV